MSKRSLIVKLKREAENVRFNNTVKEISDIMDELSAAATGGSARPAQTLEQLFDDSKDITR